MLFWVTRDPAMPWSWSSCRAPGISAASKCGEFFRIRSARWLARSSSSTILIQCSSSPEGMDARPHPHIGLAMVTYLFDGRVMHRDSQGHVQEIAPGAMNLMTAGRGIAHSERTPDAERQAG